LGNIGITFSHQWIALTLSGGINNIQQERRGKTKQFGIGLNSYGQKWGFDLYFRMYKGHFISNEEIIQLPEFADNKQYPVVPSLQTLYSGLNAYYIFNHKKFSYRSSFLHNEIQQKSAGSFLLMGSYSFFRIRSDTGFIPAGLRPVIPITSQINEGNFNSFSIMPGYAHTFVWKKKYFLTLSPSVGLMAQQQKFFSGKNDFASYFDGSILFPRVMGRLGIGYNSYKWYWGLSAIADHYTIKLPANDRIVYNIGDAHFYIGYRLDVPKRFQKWVKKVEDLTPTTIIDNLMR
jgi:hypothetical protein